jgi:hypothetical protein
MSSSASWPRILAQRSVHEEQAVRFHVDDGDPLAHEIERGGDGLLHGDARWSPNESRRGRHARRSIVTCRHVTKLHLTPPVGGDHGMPTRPRKPSVDIERFIARNRAR